MINKQKNRVPAGYQCVTPYLAVHEAESLIEFLKNAFDADITEKIISSDGKIKHAEVRIGDSMIMIGGKPRDAAELPGMFYVYVDDADRIHQKALQAGASSIMEPRDLFYGDRNAAVQDGNGNQWYIATRIEDLTSEEIQRRADAAGFTK